jgi:hypothetical protein
VSDAASIDQGYSSCSSFAGSTSSATGVWLHTVGNGAIVTASVCENNPVGTSLSVFQGDCQSLSCIQPISGDCSNMWESLEGEEYYIFVSQSMREDNHIFGNVFITLANIFYVSGIRSKPLRRETMS